ncbi:MAG: energy transducer TonB [Proteobacteria bacterium]|nr:energy transducer TonB [Pseudomonadota bacterium]MBU2260473.1 energy transducer TonB [Pseudomonadota bacterium]
MRENYLGAAISILVHSSVILLLVAASFNMQNRPVKMVEIDFSLMKDPAKGSPPKVEKEIIEKKPRILKGETMPKRIVEPNRPVKKNPETVPVKDEVEPLPVPSIITASATDPGKERVELPHVPTIVTASDAEGEMVVHGTPATYAGSSGSGNILQAHGGSANGKEGAESGGRGTGKGGEVMLEEGKDYNYIRDAVMKNIGYPERARRMGFEGKTLLSFMVLENGTTSQIKVEKSSGYRLLDDSAKEGIARTVIPRKVSYRVVVRLPITFTLRVSKGDGT